MSTKKSITAKKAVKTVKQATKKISSTKAVELMKNSGGRFVGVSFVTNKGKDRVINGRFVSVSNLGYVKINETKSKNNPGGIKSVNTRTLKGFTCNGETYKISK